jgi:hypothetical protein
MGSEGRWEWLTHKTCGCQGGTNMRINVIGWERNFWCQLTRSWHWLFNPDDKNTDRRTLLKHQGMWRRLALRSIPGDDTSGTDIKSDLTARSSQKIQNPVLLWLDSNQGLDSKDIDDFLFFSMDLVLTWSMVQEICFIEVDECCWNSEVGRLEETDYIELSAKIQNENSRNFEYQTCIHLPLISIKYSSVSCR